CPVVDNWAAYRGSKLILLEHWFGLACLVGEEVTRIEQIVAQELPCCSVKIVRSRLAYQVHIRARSASIGRVVIARLHLEFLNSIRSRHCDTHLLGVVHRRVLRLVVPTPT